MTDGLLETEIKLRISSPEAAQELLSHHGFRVVRPKIFETNGVYDLSDAALRSRGQLLRLRLAGDQAILTWKGPEISGPHKSRPETEVEVSDFDICSQLLRNLGYVLVFRYDKYRTEFQEESDSGTVTLDETPIGSFLELEGKPEWIDRTAAALGFRTSDYITESYSTLYLEYCRAHQLEPTFMVFPA